MAGPRPRLDGTSVRLALNAGPSFGPTKSWREAARRAGTHSLVIWPPLAIGRVVWAGLQNHAVAFDFGHAYLPAAHAVLAGNSPFPAATAAALAPRTAFVYPPLTAYLVAPFTAISTGWAEGIATALAVAAVVGILWVVGVRDWRCYLVVFLWEPVYSAIQTANVNLLIALGLALVWRYRDRPTVAALATGAIIALKPFLWPIAVWLLCTRRFRTALASVVLAAFFVFAPWAAIGFAGLGDYPHLLSVLSRVEGHDAYTIQALLGGMVPWRAAGVVGIAVGVAALAGAARIGARDERRSFALGVAACLLLSPIVWMDYFVLLLVVLGVLVGRFGPAWLLPLLFWIAPQVGNGAVWQTAACLAVGAATFWLAIRRPPAQPRPPASISIVPSYGQPAAR
jgi:Glycosyltransferase family 87